MRKEMQSARRQECTSPAFLPKARGLKPMRQVFWLDRDPEPSHPFDQDSGIISGTFSSFVERYLQLRG